MKSEKRRRQSVIFGESQALFECLVESMSQAKPMRLCRRRNSSGVEGAATLCLPLLILSVFVTGSILA